jgi:hypothetical protein
MPFICIGKILNTLFNANSIWVNLPKGMTKKQIEEINKSYVICEGIFHAEFHELSDINRLETWPFERSTK